MRLNFGLQIYTQGASSNDGVNKIIYAHMNKRAFISKHTHAHISKRGCLFYYKILLINVMQLEWPVIYAYIYKCST